MPHNLLFLIYNFVYIAPVVYVYFFGFSVGGADKAIKLSTNTISDMLFFYSVAVASFYLGSFLSSFLIKLKIKKSVFCCDIFKYKTTKFQSFVFLFFCLVFIIFKVLLYREGVYSYYAFDSGAMTSKIWTVSMGLSELMIIFFIFFLLTENKYKALLSFLLISINLLHGTRIFTLICCLVIFFYYVFHKKKIYGVKLFFFGIISFFIVLIIFYGIFLYRIGSLNTISNFSLELIVSPIVYESIFNQISFVRMLDFIDLGVVDFSPHMLLIDTLIFVTPNVFGDSKIDLMYVNKFGELSPLGGLSGYASSIIYFSNYYFVWYFLLGAILGLLFKASRTGHFHLLSKTMYVYVVCDTLFRLHRDPYFMAGKMLINNFIILILFLLAPYITKKLLIGNVIDDCKC